MTGLDRRQFLQSASGLAAALAAGPSLLARTDHDHDHDHESRPDGLFLTYRRDPCTSVTVQWFGEATDTRSLTVSATPLKPMAWRSFPVTARPFPLSDVTIFRSELEGLTPGTEYRFRIGDSAADFRFRTMPATLTDSFTFISGGDCATNAHTLTNNRMAASHDPMFVVIGGDLGYDNGRSPGIALQFVRNYSQTMLDSQGRLIPMVVCIGNHEVDGGYSKSRAHAPFFFALHDGLFADTSFAALDVGDYLSLMLLDTGHVAPIGGAQTHWLDGALRERAERPHVIVVNHVPAYPSFRPESATTTKDGKESKGGTGEGNRKYWVPLFEKYHVDLVLEHHDHTFKRTHPLKEGLKDPNGILYLGDGSWGRLRAPKTAENRPYLAVASQSYHLTLHRIEGDRRFHLALHESGRILDIATTAKRPRRITARSN